MIPGLILILVFGFIKKSNYYYELASLVIIYTIGDITALTLALKGINNMPLFHTITFLEFGLLALIYRKNFKSKKRKSLGVFTILICLLLVYNTLYIEDIWEFDSFAKMITSLVLIFFSMIWFIKIFKEMVIEKLSDDPMFYINSGVLLYFSGNFFIFTYYNYVASRNGEVMNEIWNIHSILNIIYSLLLAIAVWKMRAKYQSE